MRISWYLMLHKFRQVSYQKPRPNIFLTQKDSFLGVPPPAAGSGCCGLRSRSGNPFGGGAASGQCRPSAALRIPHASSFAPASKASAKGGRACGAPPLIKSTLKASIFNHSAAVKRADHLKSHTAARKKTTKRKIHREEAGLLGPTPIRKVRLLPVSLQHQPFLQ
jgi:hypothetical protein